MNDVDQEIQVLKGLVSRYSPTLQESEAVGFCVSAMTELGFNGYRDEAGNAIGILGNGPDDIVLLGHIDTVPGFIEIREQGDTLWGRGSVDAKGPLAAFISAAARCGSFPGWRIVVIGAICEEGDSRGAYHVVDKFHPRAAIIGEPSGANHITLGYKGTLPFRYKITRGKAHSSAKGPNANEIAFDFWQRLGTRAGQFNEGKNRAFDQLSLTLKEMHSSSDGFYDTAFLDIGVRLPANLLVSEAIALIKQLASDGEVEFGDCIPAFQAEKNNFLVRAFLSSIRTNNGKPSFLLKTGTADMNIVGPVWNCPILAYGPGDLNLDHTPDEHISILEYKQSISILERTIREICSTPIEGLNR